MRSWHSLLLFAVLAACGGKDKDATDGKVDGDADTDADADADTDADTDVCGSVIASVDPPADAQDVPLDTVVTVEFDVPVPASGTYTVELSDGATAVAGSTELATDRLSMTFTPDAPLAAETVFTLEAQVCDATVSHDFTTAPAPVDVALVEGSTYALRWQDVTITEPQNPDALALLIDIDFVLLQLRSVDPVTLEAPAIATIAYDDGNGNPVPECDSVVEEIADFSLNPFFSFQGDITLVVDPDSGQTADVEDFELLAKFAADGSEITNVQVSGLVATEQFLDGFDCNSIFVQALQPTCLPCASSKTGECMLLEGNAPNALLQPGVDVIATCGL